MRAVSLVAYVLASLTDASPPAMAQPDPPEELCFATEDRMATICITATVDRDGLEVCLLDVGNDVESCLFAPRGEEPAVDLPPPGV
ncbi:hypothetical protein [Acuticoccus sediminis]|uniref:hypothetical protein n=1 Tax=Acuticoccus sediminis TaxID=2184697 RepID=UPI001CFDB63C|nr:hypothetical protein [Acuticoccus sediminis]